MRPEILFDYFKSVTSLKGVGPALANTLHRVMASHLPSLPTVRDLLFYPPVDVIDRRFSPPLYSAPADVVCTFEVTIDAHIEAGSRMRHASKKPHRVQCSNESGDLMLVFFHAAGDWLKNSMPVGQKRLISGKTEKFDFRLQMTHPDIIAPVSQSDKVMVVEPQYPLTQGLSNKKLRELISSALSNAPDLPEWYATMPGALVTPMGFTQALKKLHTPSDVSDLATDTPHYMRLCFDELVAEQLLLHEARAKIAAQDGIVLFTPTACGGGQGGGCLVCPRKRRKPPQPPRMRGGVVIKFPRKRRD